MQSRQYLLLQLITQLWLHPSLKCGGQNMNRYNCCCSLRIPYTCSEIILRLRRKLLKTSTFASGAQKYAIFHCFRIYFQKIANFVSVNTIFVVFCVHNFAVFMRKNQLKFSPPPHDWSLHLPLTFSCVVLENACNVPACSWSRGLWFLAQRSTDWAKGNSQALAVKADAICRIFLFSWHAWCM